MAELICDIKDPLKKAKASYKSNKEIAEREVQKDDISNALSYLARALYWQGVIKGIKGE